MSTSTIAFDRVRDSLFKKHLKKDRSISAPIQTHRDVEFVPAVVPDTYAEEIKKRYEPINKPNGESLSLNEFRMKRTEEAGGGKESGNHTKADLPSPSFHVSSELLSCDWINPRNVGPGLVNLGNTCFLNSVLQVLSYTPPLWEYLCCGKHQRTCKQSGFCSVCQLSRLFLQMSCNSQTPVPPHHMIRNIKLIRSHFRPGRQEDAHEFLRAYVESMQGQFLARHKALDRYSQETTVVSHIFGGWFRSTVQCSQCKHQSVTFDPLYELNLDIGKCNDLTSALNAYCSSDTITGNKYPCGSCNNKVNATKKVLIQQHPKVLTIQMKRFNYTNSFNSKINKLVSFCETLDLSPYIFNCGRKVTYSLYGVIVHRGGSCGSGHYYSFAKSSSGVWCELNDEVARCVSLQRVLSEQAYMLFYIENRDNSCVRVSEPGEVAGARSGNLSVMQNHLALGKRPASSGTDVAGHGRGCASSSTSSSGPSNTLPSSKLAADWFYRPTNGPKTSDSNSANQDKCQQSSGKTFSVALWDKKERVVILKTRSSEKGSVVESAETSAEVPASAPPPLPVTTNSVLGFGDRVTSWDGGPNTIDKKVEHRPQKRRHQMDIEMDSGKKRKNKTKKASYSMMLYKQNPFQAMHDKVACFRASKISNNHRSLH